MTHDSTIKAMRDEKNRLASQAQSLKAQLDIVLAELSDLETAEKVLARFQTVAMMKDEAEPTPPGGITRAKGTDRPEGIPTTPDMALTLLSEARERGMVGLPASVIYEQIKRRWWPGAPYNAIIPTISRLVRVGRLTKIGDLYSVPLPYASLEVSGNPPGNLF